MGKPKIRWLVSLLIILNIPLVLFLRACDLFGLRFRFGEIRTHVLGHFVFDIEYYLRKKKLVNSKSIDLFFITGDTSNIQWLKMVKRKVFISPVVEILFRANALLPNYKTYQIEKIPERVSSRDYDGIFERTELEIAFTPEENDKGKIFLRNLGIESTDKFICLMVRDAAYKNSLSEKREWSYHNYRDSNINTYVEAINALADKGYWVFRMGKLVIDPLNTLHAKIIDYASSDLRNDFMEIWLSANCSMCISTGFGLDEVPGINDIPTVFVNLLPLQHIPLYKFSLTHPKRLIWRETGDLLNIDEYMQHSYISSGEYEAAGIRIVDLTSEEINKTVMEMESVLRGERLLSDAQLHYQEQLIQSIFDLDKEKKRRYQYHLDKRAGIASMFLDQHLAGNRKK